MERIPCFPEFNLTHRSDAWKARGCRKSQGTSRCFQDRCAWSGYLKELCDINWPIFTNWIVKNKYPPSAAGSAKTGAEKPEKPGEGCTNLPCAAPLGPNCSVWICAADMGAAHLASPREGAHTGVSAQAHTAAQHPTIPPPHSHPLVAPESLGQQKLPKSPE